jgi:transposase
MRSIQNAEIASTGDERANKRQYRSKQERRQIAEESLQPGASAAVVARHHGVNANQIFHWRKLLREGRLDQEAPSAQLIPVRIADVVEEQCRQARHHTGCIQIEIGRTRIRIEGSADPENLRLILEHLGR